MLSIGIMKFKTFKTSISINFIPRHFQYTGILHVFLHLQVYSHTPSAVWCQRTQRFETSVIIYTTSKITGFPITDNLLIKSQQLKTTKLSED